MLRLMTAEQGKPLAEARGEIAYAAAYFDCFAEAKKDAIAFQLQYGIII